MVEVEGNGKHGKHALPHPVSRGVLCRLLGNDFPHRGHVLPEVAAAAAAARRALCVRSVVEEMESAAPYLEMRVRRFVTALCTTSLFHQRSKTSSKNVPGIRCGPPNPLVSTARWSAPFRSPAQRVWRLSRNPRLQRNLQRNLQRSSLILNHLQLPIRD